MNDTKLNTSVSHDVVLSPRMIQSLNVLQMDSQGLVEYINAIAETNPTMEVEPPDDLIAGYRELRKLPHTDIDYPAFLHESDYSDPFETVGTNDRQFDSLAYFLVSQLGQLSLPGSVYSLACYISELLDDNGYIRREDYDEICRLNAQDDVETALRALQSLEPSGVGARNLPECLKLQLDRLQGSHCVEGAIVAEHLDLLADKRYGRISRLLGVPESDVMAAAAVISKLDPKPGSSFFQGEPAVYIRPDVIVTAAGDELVVSIDEQRLPGLRISPEYARMAGEIDDDETVRYLRSKINETLWLMSSIERRKATMLLCCKALVELQKEFFRTRGRRLIPVGLSDIAGLTGLHVSTVSRAFNGRHLQCSEGIFPIRFFLEHPSSKTGGEVSSYSAKLLLERIVRSEPKDKPFSDEKIVTLMGLEGVRVARRTVAKYRGLVGIPCSSARKRRMG